MNQVKAFCLASVANVSCGFYFDGGLWKPIGDEMIIREVNSPKVTIFRLEGYKLPYKLEKMW